MNHQSPLQRTLLLAFLGTALGACGGGSGGDGNGGNGGSGADGGAGEECVATAEAEVSCTDGVDNNCNGLMDCEDVECSFDPNCVTDVEPEDCGEAAYAGDPLAIPDGNGTAYETSVSINGFDDGQILETSDGFLSACVVMEHSWLRDLQIELVCPSGQTVILQQFLGTNGSELYMGMPNDDDGIDPTPGVGDQYCWTANATNEPMLEWANNNPTAGTLPPGDYLPSSPSGMDGLVGCTLNGDWTIRAIDDWGIDNGYIFEWTVSFSTDIIPDCSEWID